MHFREVNKKLKQLKSEVFWSEESLKGVDWFNLCYDSLVKDYKQALNALEQFRNTTIAQLKG